MNNWFDVNALYQIYPRSFMDSDGDGIGDLRGIISKLDYLSETLGVDALWLSPFFCSPMLDLGYDITNHCDVDPLFGTLDDFNNLLDEVHKRNMKMLIDYIPNHTSNQHPWFQNALSGRDSEKRNYYVWRDPKPDGSPPNNWMSIFGGSIWEFDEKSTQYYMHSFLKEQPDLDWTNPVVREEMKKVMKFWFNMGVDGFRVDAIWQLAKDEEMRDDPPTENYNGSPDGYGSQRHIYSRFGPRLSEYLKEIASVAQQYENRFLIYEHTPDGAFGEFGPQFRLFYDIDSKTGSPLNFQPAFVPWKAEEFASFFNYYQSILKPDEMPVYCFGNHDQIRVASRFGSEQARLVAVMLLTIPGLPVVYYGDEIGMENVSVLPEERFDTRATENTQGGRDGQRTPMQWSEQPQAGFSTVKPWLPVSETYTECNVEKASQTSGSILELYRCLLDLRRQNPALRSGAYRQIESQEGTFVYERRSGSEVYVVALNFSQDERTIFISYQASIICATHNVDRPVINDRGEITLRASEGVVVKIA